MENEMINVTGLWKNTDKKGNDKAPDLRLVFAENKPRDTDNSPPPQDNEDIPF